MKKSLLLVFILLFSLFVVSCEKKPNKEEPTPKEDSILKLNSKDQIDTILKYFWSDEKSDHPNAYLDENNNAMWDASLWDYGALFTAGIRYYRLYEKDEQSTVIFNRIMEGLEWYRSTDRTDDHLVYASQNGNEKPEFYDDNAWLVLGFIDAYNITGNKEYLDKAIKIQKYVYTGWVDGLEGDPYSGGLLWREYKKDEDGNFIFDKDTEEIARNTCINGPAAMASALLYQITNDKSYLDWAVKIYDWTVKHLRNDRGLYFDYVFLNSRGEFGLDETVYSYNTGTMISAGVYLYEITKNQKYLDQAVQSAKTYQTFKGTNVKDVKNAKLYLSENEPWFRVYLFNGFNDLARVDSKYSEFSENSILGIKHLYKNGLDANGLLLKKWGLDTQEKRIFELRHIVGNLESLIIFAEYEMFIKE